MHKTRHIATSSKNLDDSLDKMISEQKAYYDAWSQDWDRRIAERAGYEADENQSEKVGDAEYPQDLFAK